MSDIHAYIYMCVYISCFGKYSDVLNIYQYLPTFYDAV